MALITKLIMKYYHLIFKPQSKGTITNTNIRKIFKGITRNIFVSDIVYRIPRKKDIVDFLKLHLFKFRQYVPEKYDCDNYAFSLMGMFTNLMSGYAIGIVWVHTPNGGHALNFYIDEKGEMWYIEPQTNQIFKKEEYVPFLIVM